VTIQLPILTTQRLALFPVDPALARPMLAYQLKNSAHFAQWDPTPSTFYYSEQYWATRFKLRQRDWHEGRGASWVLTLPEQPDLIIGSVSLSNLVRGVLQVATLGYSIDADFQGQGLMREALQAVIEFAFGVLQLHRLQANYQPHNQRSGALLERLGFTIEGRAQQYLFLNGAWRDHVLTSLTNHDFNPANLPV
jgi:ribosomal-protein-alanine N-acetyltransferase